MGRFVSENTPLRQYASYKRQEPFRGLSSHLVLNLHMVQRSLRVVQISL